MVYIASFSDLKYWHKQKKHNFNVSPQNNYKSIYILAHYFTEADLKNKRKRKTSANGNVSVRLF